MNFHKPNNIFEYMRLFALYNRAFPISEKKPISMILKMEKCGATDVWYFEEGGEFLGLAITINSPELILVDYFAVSKKLRGRGNGERMLKALISHYTGKVYSLRSRDSMRMQKTTRTASVVADFIRKGWGWFR